MRKKFIASILSAALALSTAGCADSAATSLTALDASTSANSADSSETVTSTAAATTAATTSSAETTTTTAAPAPKPDPVAVDMNYIINSRAYFTKANTVTSNDELKKTLDELDEMILKFGQNLGFAYYNPQTGITVSYNANKSFQTCSTIKVPYIEALLESGVNLDEEVTINRIYTDAAPEEGHLTVNDYHKKYTVRKLIENSVKLSDNTAYVNLIDRFGRYVFNSHQYSSGINYLLSEGYYFSMCTASAMLESYKGIYNYSLNDKNGEWLVDLMTNTSFNYQISAALSQKYKVAHKYGSDMETNSYHDCAICFAESPYIICIFTEQVPETDAANESFHKLALIFDKLNEILVS